tara:strand:+ start:155 stop:463 length:309 start_codon:yes stop_codon:yes gene_type:complete
MNNNNVVLYAYSKDDLETLIKNVIDKVRKTELIEDTNISPEEDRLSQKEAAQLLGVTVQTLITWKKQGKVTFYQIGRSIFYSKKELLNLARNNSTLVGLSKQ